MQFCSPPRCGGRAGRGEQDEGVEGGELGLQFRTEFTGGADCEPPVKAAEMSSYRFRLRTGSGNGLGCQ